MLKSIYRRHFAKDKPFRHYTQHLAIGAIGFFLSASLFHYPLTLSNIFLFFLFSYLIDIDGLLSVFFSPLPEANKIKQLLIQGHFHTAATEATINHKKFNRLILHNLFGLLFVLLLLGFSYLGHNSFLLVVSSAILTHFLFDISDDIAQIGHIKNWLWPIRQIFS